MLFVKFFLFKYSQIWNIDDKHISKEILKHLDELMRKSESTFNSSTSGTRYNNKQGRELSEAYLSFSTNMLIASQSGTTLSTILSRFLIKIVSTF